MSHSGGMTSNEELGRAIRQRREAQQISQDRLAGLADIARTTIVNVEAGRGAKPASLRRIARALDVDVRTLTDPDTETTQSREEPSPGSPSAGDYPSWLDAREREVWDKFRIYMHADATEEVIRYARYRHDQQAGTA